MWDLLQHLLSGELTPEERQVVLRSFWRALVIAHITWACGWWAAAGLGAGFALAETVDERFQAMEVQYQRTLDENDRRWKQIEKFNKGLLIEQLGSRIRDWQRSCVLAPADSSYRESLIRTLESAQTEYIQLTGYRYPIDKPCT